MGDDGESVSMDAFKLDVPEEASKVAETLGLSVVASAEGMIVGGTAAFSVGAENVGENVGFQEGAQVGFHVSLQISFQTQKSLRL